jgi:DNA-binding transcriptional MerR regulator
MIDTDEREISAKRCAELGGISYRQLDYWARIGILTPSIAEAQGSGSKRLYSIADARIARALAAICELGAPISGLAGLVDELALVKSWEGPLFVTLAGRIGRSLEILDGAPAGAVLDLAVIAQAIEQLAAQSEEPS